MLLFFTQKLPRKKDDIVQKTRIFRALSFVTAFLLALSVILGAILERFRPQVDETLGTQSQILVSDITDTSQAAYAPPAELLGEDGHIDTQKAIQHFIDFGRELAAGGTVLLKNNGALPLQRGSNITLLGMKSHYPIVGSGQGQPIVGPVITLEDALSKTRTDFRNPDRNVWRNNIQPDYSTFDDYDFVGGDMKLNPVPMQA